MDVVEQSNKMSLNTVAVLGLGYIGLPTAALFAKQQINVLGVDVNADLVRDLRDGFVSIVEPGLEHLVRKVLQDGYLDVATSPDASDAFLIAVPTPFKNDASHKKIPQPDLSFVEAAARSIAPVLKSDDLVILESTSPVGTTELVSQWMSEERSDLTFPHTHGNASDIRVAYCPERILPGNALEELVSNDRVIGGLTQACSERARDLYHLFVRGECVVTDARTAELTKLTENASRDVGIAFANELSLICDELGVDVWELIRLANRHPRVDILQPGPGVGGHCIAVDPWFIAASCPERSRLIVEARTINDSKPDWVIQKVLDIVDELKHGNTKPAESDLTIACYGLAFKKNIDDLRESPAAAITEAICRRHPGRVLIIEPNIRRLPSKLKGGTLLQLDNKPIEADVHVLLVDHDEFLALRPESGVIIDTRGIWNER